MILTILFIIFLIGLNIAFFGILIVGHIERNNNKIIKKEEKNDKSIWK
jgi:hypothetical protein